MLTAGALQGQAVPTRMPRNKMINGRRQTSPHAVLAPYPGAECAETTASLKKLSLITGMGQRRANPRHMHNPQIGLYVIRIALCLFAKREILKMFLN